jgi:hypothetical protein
MDDVMRALAPYKLTDLQRNLEAAFDDEIPDAGGFQRAFCSNGGDALGPEESLEIIRDVVDETFPEDEYGKSWVDIDEDKFGVGRADIPLRILAALYACLWLVSRIERRNN